MYILPSSYIALKYFSSGLQFLLNSALLLLLLPSLPLETHITSDISHFHAAIKCDRYMCLCVMSAPRIYGSIISPLIVSATTRSLRHLWVGRYEVYVACSLPGHSNGRELIYLCFAAQLKCMAFDAYSGWIIISISFLEVACHRNLLEI